MTAISKRGTLVIFKINYYNEIVNYRRNPVIDYNIFLLRCKLHGWYLSWMDDCQ